jgi:hypothetical protein
VTGRRAEKAASLGGGRDPDRGDQPSFADFADAEGNTSLLEERGLRRASDARRAIHRSSRSIRFCPDMILA